MCCEPFLFKKWNLYSEYFLPEKNCRKEKQIHFVTKHQYSQILEHSVFLLVFSVWLSTYYKLLVLPALFICNCSPSSGLDMKVADGSERSCCKCMSCFCLCFCREINREGCRNSKAALQPTTNPQSFSEFPSLLPVPDTSNPPAGILNAAFIHFIAREVEVQFLLEASVRETAMQTKIPTEVWSTCQLAKD